MSEVDKKFDIFQLKSAVIPSKAYCIMSSVFLERLPTFGLQNEEKSTQFAQKQKG